MLCASCSKDYFFSDKRCTPCDDTGLSSGSVAAIATIAGVGVVLIIYKYMVRSRAKSFKPILHNMRRRYSRKRDKVRRRKRRRQRRKRQMQRNKRRGQPTTETTKIPDSANDDDSDRLQHLIVSIEKAAVQVVHGAVTSATKGFAAHTETMRIFFNLSKVLTHLYGTLQWCASFPKAMNNLLAMTAVFALDFGSASKLPCWLTGFTYFSKVKFVMIAPLTIVVVIGIGGLIWATQCQRGTQAERTLWKVATVVLFIVDLIYPTASHNFPPLKAIVSLAMAGCSFLRIVCSCDSR